MNWMRWNRRRARGGLLIAASSRGPGTPSIAGGRRRGGDQQALDHRSCPCDHAADLEERPLDGLARGGCVQRLERRRRVVHVSRFSFGSGEPLKGTGRSQRGCCDVPRILLRAAGRIRRGASARGDRRARRASECLDEDCGHHDPAPPARSDAPGRSSYASQTQSGPSTTSSSEMIGHLRPGGIRRAPIVRNASPIPICPTPSAARIAQSLSGSPRPSVEEGEEGSR